MNSVDSSQLVNKENEILAKANKIVFQANSKNASEIKKAAIDLVSLYCMEKHNAEAEMILAHYQNIAQIKSNTDSLSSAESFVQLGLLLATQNKYIEAEMFLSEAINQFPQEVVEPNSHLCQSSVMLSLAHLYTLQNKCSEAEAVLKRALRQRVKVYGVKHPGIAAGLETYAQVLKQANKQMLAGKMEMRAREIRSDLLNNLS